MKKLIIRMGDITDQKVEAIVNAANPWLIGGGGVDGCIHRKAGPLLDAACAKLKGCRRGSAKLTLAYDLPQVYVIHAVGPRCTGNPEREDATLARCYRRILKIAEKYRIKSVAIPAISTGAYRMPMERSARVSLTEVKKFMFHGDHKFPDTVVLVCFDAEAYSIYQRLTDRIK